MLDQQTLQRLRELFADKTCQKCGGTAQRIWRHDYYCQPCFPAGRDAAEVRVHRLFPAGGFDTSSRN